MGLVLGKKREEKEIKELVPRKIETLVRALQDKNTAIRRVAARTLQQKANLESLTGEAVKALEAALNDADKKVRMHSAGALTPEKLTVAEIKQLITGAGRIPVQRDTLYNIVEGG